MVLLCASMILSILHLGGVPLAHALSAQPVSVVFVEPLKTCCKNVGDTFWVNVRVNLTSGASINLIDVRLNYTNVYNPNTRTGAIQAVPYQGINYTNNIFSGYSGGPIYECVDGSPIIDQGCANDDFSIGQVHFGQVIIGSGLVSGPKTNVLLFGVLFKVFVNGTSIFSLDRTNLSNPNRDPSNPGLINPQPIQVITRAGVFGNKGLVAFFNFRPAVPPAILPGPAFGGVIFDGNASFNAVNLTRRIVQYAWSFGDGNSQSPSASPMATHVFGLPGRYPVELNATDDHGVEGSIIRRVTVLPALGNLTIRVRDLRGTVLTAGVQVRVFNSTLSSSPFFNETIDANGQVAFYGLLPSTYFLTFSGPSVVAYSKMENVTPGWTTQDSVYLTVIPPPPPPNNPDIASLIYLGTIIGGLGIITILLVRRRRLKEPNSAGKTFSGRSKAAGR